MSLVVKVPPAAEPVSTTELISHSRIGTADGLEAARLLAAREHVESLSWRALVLQTFEERLDGWPPVIRLQRTPLRSLESLQYVDIQGQTQTLDSALYQVDSQGCPPRLQPVYGQIWPVVIEELNVVRIVYRAGHLVPFTVDTGTGVLTATGHWFADGDAVPVWNTGGALPTVGGAAIAGTYYVRDVDGDTLKLAASSGGAALSFDGAGTGTQFLGDLPFGLRAAMLLLAAELNERREEAIAGVLQKTVLAAEHLIQPWRVR